MQNDADGIENSYAQKASDQAAAAFEANDNKTENPVAEDEAKDEAKDDDDAPPPPPALVRSTTRSYDQFEGRCSSERGASLWSFISFSWMNDLIEVGHMTPLSMDHIYLLETSDLPSTNARALQDAWDKMGRHRSLARAVHAVFWKPLWLAGALQAVVVGTTLMTPAVLNKLLSYVQNPVLAQAETGAWNGYVFGACLVLLMLFQQIAQTQYVVCVCVCVCVYVRRSVLVLVGGSFQIRMGYTVV